MSDLLRIQNWNQTLTPWFARVFKPGHGPRISLGPGAMNGCWASATILAEESTRGPGGGAGGRIARVGMILASCSFDRPARLACGQNARTWFRCAKNATKTVKRGAKRRILLLGLEQNSWITWNRNTRAFYNSRWSSDSPKRRPVGNKSNKYSDKLTTWARRLLVNLVQ